MLLVLDHDFLNFSEDARVVSDHQLEYPIFFDIVERRFLVLDRVEKVF